MQKAIFTTHQDTANLLERSFARYSKRNLHQHHIHGLTSSSGLYLEPGASIRNTVTPTPAGASTGTNLSYTYDAFGNRKSKTKNGATINYNYNTANELTGTTGASTATISHNTNGDITNDGTYSYTYNSEHQLTNITGNGKSIEYKYHGADRYKKTVNGTVYYYLNSGNDLSAELDASGNITTTYIGSVAEIKNTGTITYKSVDTMGSVVLLTDASGAVQGTNTYLPFGESSKTGSASSNLTYTGQEADSESSLMYYNARYYNPELGRFMNRDINRTGDVLTHNDYAYVRNNPFRYTDPSGEIEEFLKNAGKGAKNVQEAILETTNKGLQYASGASSEAEYNDSVLMMSNSSNVWNAAISNPKTTGAVVGITSGGAFAAGVAGGVIYHASIPVMISRKVFLPKRIFAGAVYTYLAADSLSNIPSNIKSATSVKKGDISSAKDFIVNVGLDYVPGIIGETFEAVVQTLQFTKSVSDKIIKNI